MFTSPNTSSGKGSVVSFFPYTSLEEIKSSLLSFLAAASDSMDLIPQIVVIIVSTG